MRIFPFALLLLVVPAACSMAAEGVAVDKAKGTVSIDAKIAPRKIADEKYQGKVYPIEVIASWAYPKGQKAHETVVTIDCKPSEVHKALEELGLKPGVPRLGEGDAEPQGPGLNLYLDIPGPDGQPKRLPIERALVDPRTNKPMPKVTWRFTGSAMSQPDPAKPEKVYGADVTGTLIAIFPVTNQTVCQTNLTMKYEKFLKLETNKDLLPKEGTPVKLVLEIMAR